MIFLIFLWKVEVVNGKAYVGEALVSPKYEFDERAISTYKFSRVFLKGVEKKAVLDEASSSYFGERITFFYGRLIVSGKAEVSVSNFIFELKNGKSLFLNVGNTFFIYCIMCEGFLLSEGTIISDKIIDGNILVIKDSFIITRIEEEYDRKLRNIVERIEKNEGFSKDFLLSRYPYFIPSFEKKGEKEDKNLRIKIRRIYEKNFQNEKIQRKKD